MPAVRNANALKSAAVTASVVTDTNGAQRLAFSSNSAAFQVGAANKTANALLGNFKIAGQPEGAAVAATVTGGTVATAAGTGTVALKVIANGVEQTLSVDITGATAQLKVDAINTALDGAATATGLHATLDGTPATMSYSPARPAKALRLRPPAIRPMRWGWASGAAASPARRQYYGWRYLRRHRRRNERGLCVLGQRRRCHPGQHKCQ